MKHTFFWSASPPRALAESALVAVVLLALLAAVAGQASPVVLGNGLAATSAVTGTWCALRMRVPGARWPWRWLVELVVAAALGGGLAGLALLMARAGGASNFVDRASVGVGGAQMLLLACTPGYLMLRVAVRAWLVWDRLRRRRLLWALTHAHLLVVVLGAVFFVVVGAGVAFSTQPAYDPAGAPSAPVASVVEQLVMTLFPLISIMTVMTAIVLLFVLPPSALFSFLVARTITGRLERLARATAALRAGDYAVRVDAAGEDEIARLQSDFNAMAADLERAMRDLQAERDRVAALLRARSELAASVSHELRTPVATVRGYLESALSNWDDAPPETLRQDLAVMDGEVARLQGLIDDLFTVSRAEAGGLAVTLGPVDAGAVVGRAVAALARLAWESARVEVVADVPAGLPPARADASRLEQVLANLLRNAVRHTPPGGIVAVAVAVEGNSIAITVRDTGEGIAPEELPHIWERFYRGEGRRAEGGAGLGLAVVKELTGAMGGSVAVQSRVGEGSCFRVMLSLAGALSNRNSGQEPQRSS